MYYQYYCYYSFSYGYYYYRIINIFLVTISQDLHVSVCIMDIHILF